MFTRPAIVFALAAVSTIIGFPQIFNDLPELAEALGMPPAEWQWWNYVMVGGGLFFVSLSIYWMALSVFNTFMQRNQPQGQVHRVDAGAISHHWHVSQPTVTVTRPSFWARTKRCIRRTLWAGSTRPTLVRGIAEIERCHQELVKYICSQQPDQIGFEDNALWVAFQPHIETVCRILDEQEIPHPEIDTDIILVGTREWGTFLAKVLAVKHDVEKARLVYGEMRSGPDSGGELDE